MCIARGLVGAALGGVVGAAAWTAVSHFTGWEVGLVAWGVGGLAGAGMAVGHSMRGGRAAGVLAAAVAVVAIVAGKLGVAHFGAQRMIAETAASLTMEDARDHMAMKVERELRANGVGLNAAADEYAPEVIVERDRRWAHLNEGERREYLESVRAQVADEGNGAAEALTAVAFISSFGPFDLLWLALSVSTAYKLGAGRRAERVEEAGEAKVVEEPGPSSFFRHAPMGAQPLAVAGAASPGAASQGAVTQGAGAAPAAVLKLGAEPAPAAPVRRAGAPAAKAEPGSDLGNVGIWARLGQEPARDGETRRKAA